MKKDATNPSFRSHCHLKLNSTPVISHHMHVKGKIWKLKMVEAVILNDDKLWCLLLKDELVTQAPQVSCSRRQLLESNQQSLTILAKHQQLVLSGPYDLNLKFQSLTPQESNFFSCQLPPTGETRNQQSC
ncbi:hypothetical protein NC652_040274 [Populus alba x Populus x berolinensis]|nr:hypothetical protein NC652_040274 [Populus alba x Populus x berolinensis]